jgi:hypothetical protein
MSDKSVEAAIKYANTLDWGERENPIDILSKKVKKLSNALNNCLYILEDYEGTNAEMKIIENAKTLLNSAKTVVKHCHNCGTDLPKGCGGIFRKDGKACLLNEDC